MGDYLFAVTEIPHTSPRAAERPFVKGRLRRDCPKPGGSDINETCMTSQNQFSWKQLFTSEGRFPRSTYWMFKACFFGLFIILGGVLEMVKEFELPKWVEVVAVLLVFPAMIIFLLVQIKRWHDLDKSGAWVLINLIPCAGGLWSLVECGFIEGTKGPNQYGPDPITRSPPPLPPRLPPPLPK